MCLQQRAKALGPRPGKTPIDVSGACAYAKSEGCCPAPLEKRKGKKKEEMSGTGRRMLLLKMSRSKVVKAKPV